MKHKPIATKVETSKLQTKTLESSNQMETLGTSTRTKTLGTSNQAKNQRKSAESKKVKSTKTLTMPLSLPTVEIHSSMKRTSSLNLSKPNSNANLKANDDDDEVFIPKSSKRKKVKVRKLKIVRFYQKCPKEQEEPDEVPNPRRCTIITLSVSFAILVILLLITSFLVLTLKEQSNIEATTKKPLKIISMSQVCQDQIGMCYYYPFKYIRCDDYNITCYSVHVSPKLTIHSNRTTLGMISNVKLSFLPTNQPQTIYYIPNGVPCEDNGVVGVCEDGNCNVDALYAQLLSDKKPIEGRWSRDSQHATCLLGTAVTFTNLVEKGPIQDAINRTYTLWYKRYLKWTSCEAINNIGNYTFCSPYQFRSCTNPVPSYGGNITCWSAMQRNAMHYSQWPLKLSLSCNMCNETFPSLSKEDCQRFNTSDNCYPNKFSFDDPSIGNDFRPCCIQNIAEYIVGRCILGTCVPLS